MATFSKTPTIAIHCENIRNGGIQRVVSALLERLNHFPQFRWILLTDSAEDDGEYDLPDEILRFVLPVIYPARTDALKNILQAESVTFYWEHAYQNEKMLKKDFALCRELGVKTLLHHHSVFSNMIARGNPAINTLFETYKLADLMIVLSRADEMFFRALGLPAIYMPNPLTFPEVKNILYSNLSHNVLWLARFDAIKRPLDAVRIMEKVFSVVPDAKLIMVGSGDQTIEKEVKNYIQTHHLENGVTLEGFQKDVRKYYEDAALSLITTQFDGYNLTALESKAFGVPIVHYDLPYLETLKDGGGSVSVPQEDMDAAADTIVKLLRDSQRIELQKMSEQARISYKDFASFDLVSAYIDLFNTMLSGKKLVNSPQEQYTQEQLSLLLKTILYHYKLGLGEDRVRMILREGMALKEKEITSGLTWRLGHLLLWLPQKIFCFLKKKNCRK